MTSGGYFGGAFRRPELLFSGRLTSGLGGLWPVMMVCGSGDDAGSQSDGES